MNIDQINQTPGPGVLQNSVILRSFFTCAIRGDDNPENIVLHQLRVGTGIGFYR